MQYKLPSLPMSLVVVLAVQAFAVPHWMPEKPGLHAVQLYELIPSAHMVPAGHGDDTHSSMSTEQLVPVYPAAHKHVQLPVVPPMVPPFTQ
jgi:hypothetical protein